MSDSSQTNTPAYFVGDYIPKMRDTMLAGIIAQEHVIIIGAPGWGKTAVLKDIGQRVSGDNYIFIRLEPTAPVSKIKGINDPVALARGELIPIVKKTAYQEDAQIIHLDEWPRASEPIFDIGLDVMQREDIPRRDQPVVVATANFMVKGDRVKAMHDRFALWHWPQPGRLDVDALSDTFLSNLNARPTTPGTIPTWEEVQRVRGFTPGEKAIATIKELMRILSEEAMQQGLHLHPRKVEQIERVLYRFSAYVHDAPDFDEIPSRALQVLRYCWPAPEEGSQSKWHEVVTNLSDPVAAALEAAMKAALAAFREYQQHVRDTNTPEALSKLGAILSDADENLRQIAGEDHPKIEECRGVLTMWLWAVKNNKDPLKAAKFEL